MIDLPPSLILPHHWIAKRPAIILAEMSPVSYSAVEVTRQEGVRAILPGLTPIVAGRRATFAYLGRTSDAVDRAIYTFTNQDVGGNGGKTVTVVVGVSCVGGNNMTLSGCTIGGAAATLIAQAGSGTSSSRAALFQRTYVAAAGAATTIEFTHTGALGIAQRGGIGIWCLEGFSPTAFDTSAGFTTSDSVLNMPCDVPAFGLAICVSTDSDPTAAPAITGVATTRYNFDMETTDYQIGGDYVANSAESNRAFSAPGRTRTAVAACVASFARA